MKRLEAFREIMKKHGINYYIIPSADSHQSEYVPDYYKGRAYLSGFTGSAGTLVIGMDRAYLWTDGRYFIQAEKQLEGSGIELMKMFTAGYPSIEEWMEENLKENDVLGFDGAVISTNSFKSYEKISLEKSFEIKMDKDLLNEVWDDRPYLSNDKIFIHELKYAGMSVEDKISKVREEMNELKVDNYIISSLDDIAWLFNVRGSDIQYNPVALSYAIVSNTESVLYIDSEKVNEDVRKELESSKVTLKEYNEIYNDTEKLEGKVFIDPNKVNCKLYSLLKNKDNIVENVNITTYLKAVKNEGEIANIENSQVRDGVAMVKFIKWLKENVKNNNIDEVSAADKLEELRSKGENFKGLSFDTIAGYKEHAAMMHYSANDKTKYTLKPEGMFLVDSGAQYLDGTTDITRTFILGPISEEEKRDFTLVLKGHISLASAIFLKGITGINLDILARGPLWKNFMDYKCGTGHGVGHFLNVHEGPQGFRPSGSNAILEPGMVTTNEPGVYKKDKHGIRIENTLIVEKAFKDDEMGEFYKFRTISYCPIDLDGVDVSLLSDEEKTWLNDYHKMVYDKLNSYLDNEEREYLKEITRAI